MKTNLTRHDDSGAVMLTTALCIFAVSTLLVAGYLWLLMGHSRRVQESQRWNQAMAVAEAGIEEAMAQLNWGPDPGKSDLSANGWTKQGTAVPGMDSYGPPGKRAIAGGNYYSSFTAPSGGVNLTNGTLATIYSTGLVTAQLTGSVITRKVEVIATLVPLFPDAIDVVSNFTAKGSSVATDSWNSMSTNLSDNGLFDPNKISTNGNVGAEYGEVNLGQHKIDGSLYLGPDATAAPGSSNNVSGSVKTDNNIQITDMELPDDNWQDAVITTTNVVTIITNADNTTTTNINKNFYNFTQTGSYRITVAGGLYPIQVAPGITVTLDIQLSNFDPSAITVLGGVNNSGTVIMYQESGTATLSGNASAGGYRPINFQYYGLPGVTQITLSGTSQFIGVIYAPEASMTLNGGGHGYGVMGAIVVHDLTMNGNNYTMNYDSSLAIFGPSKGFEATSWREF